MDSSRLPEHDFVSLENDTLTMLVTKSYGPRIISLRFRGGENLFAEVPNLTLDCPGKGNFHLRGGHRLWYAQENPAVTYLPDDLPVEIISIQDGLQVTQAVEAGTGMQKTMRICLPRTGSVVHIEHKLTNLGGAAVACAPWAITMMKPGGVAILPQNTRSTDEAGVLPNRSLSLWTYTNPASPHITWGKNAILIHANLASEQEKLKVGFPNPRGWIAYHRKGTLFLKTAHFDPAQPYYDFNASSQCYCGPAFLEMETLGPQVLLPPGESVSHREDWHVFGNIQFNPTDESVQSLVEEMSLDNLTVSQSE